MRGLSFVAALLLAPTMTATGWGADLTRIDRTIPKEPAYKNKPKYCLLVVGPEARMRVWLVIDGDVLYVDRNGNGDLTQKVKRTAAAELNGSYPAGDITEPERGTKHTALAVTPQRDGGMLVSIMTEGKYRQHSGSVTFARRPQDAPIIHFHGPVSIRFSSAVQNPDRATVEPLDVDPARRRLLLHLGKDIPVPGERRQAKVVSLGAVLGTPGLGRETFATYKARDILGPNERMAVEAVFPNREGRAKPILVRGILQPDS